MYMIISPCNIVYMLSVADDPPPKKKERERLILSKSIHSTNTSIQIILFSTEKHEDIG